MKKAKRNSAPTETVVVAEPKPFVWWPWAALLAGVFLTLEIYGPSLSGPFLLDDRALPYFNPAFSHQLIAWITAGLRPVLMLTFWLNYASRGTDTFVYHMTNVALHFATSILVVLIAAKLLEWSAVEGKIRLALAVFAGTLFLVHPLQTETVSYVASRSDGLSGFFYLAAYCVFIYRRTDAIGWGRTLAVFLLFGLAIGSKEDTLTLPVLMVFTDWMFGRGGLRKNWRLYAPMAIAGLLGGLFVLSILRASNTAGLNVKDLSPAAYFYSQCRVLWMYIRLFFIPVGQNVDPDLPTSQSIFQYGAIVGFLGLIAMIVAAWIYRKRFPLAAFGVLVLLLTLAPTSSVVPIRDLLAERRMYFPILGLILVSLEILRHLKFSTIVATGAAVVVLFAALTYQRNVLWGNPIELWQDTVAKSPQKMRPRFQLAHALYEAGNCADSVRQYQVVAQLEKPDYQLYVDWALALDCAGNWGEALDKLRLAAAQEPTAHVYSQIGMIYGQHQEYKEAREALDQAAKIDPNFEMIYVYRGNIAQVSGDPATAEQEYLHALAINPENSAARAALPGVKATRKR